MKQSAEIHQKTRLVLKKTSKYFLLIFCVAFPMSLLGIFQQTLTLGKKADLTDTISHPGDLDLTFNETGYVITTTNNNTLRGTSVAIQSDGKILVAGTNWATGTDDFSVTRFHPNGELDTSFNGSGIASAPIGSDLGFGCDIVLQSDDKIIVAGTEPNVSLHSRMAAVRFDQNGLLDPTFADDGVFITSLGESSFVGNAVTATPDDQILIVGRNAVVQLTPSGSFDSSFGNDGVVKPDLGFPFWGNDITFRNNKIAVAGGSWSFSNDESNYLVMRYNSDGSLDTTFNQSGYVTTSLGLGEYDTSYYGVAIQADNKIVATGEGGANTGDSFLILARYNADGQLDPEFNQTGIITMTEAAGAEVEIQNDGKIVVVGVTYDSDSYHQLLLLRFNDDGTLDQNFGDYGIVTGLPNHSVTGRALAVQNDGKIIATGLRFVARYIGAYEAMLSLTKTVTPSIISPGHYLTYTLAFTNVGLMTAQNVVITDALPVSLTNVRVSSNRLLTDTGTTPAYVWQVEDLLPGQGGVITITGQLSNTAPSGPLVNSATIFATLEDGNPGSATATVTATVTSSSVPGSDLKIEMLDYPDPVTAGHQLTYYITVTNQGPDDAMGVVVTNTLPLGVSGSVTSGCAEDPAGVPICTLGLIAADTSASYTITMDVDCNTTGLLINRAEVNANTALVNLDDDIESENTAVNVESDLVISKYVSSQTDLLTKTVSASPGSVVTFTLMVGNNGPSSVVSGTQVIDMIPAGLTFESFVSVTGGTFGNTGNQITWVDIPEFNPNITHILIFLARVDLDATGQTIQNTVQITSIPQFDPDYSNNTNSATVIVGQKMIFLPFIMKD